MRPPRLASLLSIAAAANLVGCGSAPRTAPAAPAPAPRPATPPVPAQLASPGRTEVPIAPHRLATLAAPEATAAMTTGAATIAPPPPVAAAQPPASTASTASSTSTASTAPTGPVPPPLSPIPIDAGTDGELTATLVASRVAAPTQPGAITELSARDTAALLARLEPLPELSAPNAAAPTMRAPTPPPARPGPAQPIAFVATGGRAVAEAPIAPAAPPAHALTPPQITPQGQIQYESQIRVRFDEPMVSVAAVGEARTPPVKVSPPIAHAAWRWIDSRVLELTADPRLPQATDFTVTVPAGTRALSGAALTVDATATFSTSPVHLAGVYPSGTMRPDAAIAVFFDQRVDRGAIVRDLRAETPTGRPIAIHVVELAEARRRWALNPTIESPADPLARAAERKLRDPQYVIVAPDTAWPAGVEVQIALKKGARSAEGPRPTTAETFASFEVAPAFRVLGVQCDSAEPRLVGARCAANGGLSVELTNPLDPKTWRAGAIAIAGQKFVDTDPGEATSIGLPTPKPEGRTYEITVAAGLRDHFGQALALPGRVAFTTTAERFAPSLSARGGLFVLDPRFAIPQWVLRAESVDEVRVQLYQVHPGDYFAFQQFERGKRATPPGKLISDQHHPVGERYGAIVRADLRPALGPSGLGHVIAIATAPGVRGGGAHETAWIQVTKLGVTARVDGERATAYVDDVSPTSAYLAPASAQISLLVDGKPPEPAVATDADGHASVALLPPSPAVGGRRPSRWSRPTGLLLATTATGADSTFAVIDDYERAIREENALWYVTDDRFTYKPKEPVYVKGFVRWTDNGVNPGLALPRASERVSYTLTDQRGSRIANGTAPLSPQGGFDITVTLPENINLGTATFALEARGATHRHPISVQEFRTPAYAVSLNDDVTHAGAAPLVVGEQLEMSASAHYYAGGGLPGAALDWDASLVATSYRPPGWDRYTFAPPVPRSETWHSYRRSAGAVTVHRDARLGGDSVSNIDFALPDLPGRGPALLSVDATVVDVDRTHIRASSRPILVHASTRYVGVRQRPESDDQLELIVTDIDGRRVAGAPIDVEFEGVLASEVHRDDAIIRDRQHCAVTSTADAPATCAFHRLDDDTAYRAIARVADARHRVNTAQYDIPWMNGSPDPKTTLSIKPDRRLYRPGDVAKLQLHSLIAPATLVVSFARQGVISERRVALAADAHDATVELPILPAYTEDVHVIVDRIAEAERGRSPAHGPRADHVAAEIDLPVDVEAARLSMTARSTQPLVEPGSPATFEIEVKHGDQPQANAEVALMVVDEAVLSLSTRTFEDPLPGFYRKVTAGAAPLDTLHLFDDAGPDLDGAPGVSRYKLGTGGGGFGFGRSGFGAGGGAYGGTVGGGIGGPAIIQSRKDFRANAVFSPLLHTDAHGRASITVTMPDSLTRFRIVAIATAEARYFGKAEGTIVAQKKLNARTIAPRFLSQGDAFALPVVVQNLDPQPRTVDIAVRGANLRGNPAGKRLTIPGGGRAEVRFDLATAARGKAIVQTIVASGNAADASNVEIPVYVPATTESFATYGTVDDKPQFEQLAVPASIFTDVGGVDVELASTQLQSLTDAYWYLYAYPYECAEQRSARMLATAAMSDLLDAFAVPGRPSKAEIAEQTKVDVAKLRESQRPDGGWGYFASMKSDEYVSMQVLQALAASKVTGDVPRRAAKLVEGVATREVDALEKAALAPPARRAARADFAYRTGLAATALQTLAGLGRDERALAMRLHAAAKRLVETEPSAYPIDAKARLLAIVARDPAAAAMRTELVAALRSSVHETAASAQVTASYTDAERLLLVSNAKTSALGLDALMREAPDDAIVTKLARGVLEARHGGRWLSTQENLAALVALRHYFDRYEKDTPNYTGRLWFGGAAYAEQRFAGRDGTRRTLHEDWTQLAPKSTHDLALAKDGPGRMYYRVGITYAPEKTDLPALDAGFLVRRTYAPIDSPDDVVRTPDGWQVKLGARVQVTVEVLNTSVRHGVAVVDPLPAGFEPINEALATAERARGDTGDAWDYRNLRDSRAEVFEMQLPEGTHRFSYSVRAATPGSFLAAPAKAEEMYAPETFGRSSGYTVTIK